MMRESECGTGVSRRSIQEYALQKYAGVYIAKVCIAKVYIACCEEAERVVDWDSAGVPSNGHDSGVSQYHHQ